VDRVPRRPSQIGLSGRPRGLVIWSLDHENHPLWKDPMQSPELAFYTSEELILELMGRQTFYGCVVHSADDHKRDAWEERMFKVHFNQNLDQVRAGRLLSTVAEYLNVHLS